MDTKKLLLKYSFVTCVFYILISTIIMKYIVDLEEKNCECSNYWYRDFIKYFTLLFVIIVCIYVYDQKTFLKTILNNNLYLLLLSLLKFFGIIYFCILILYFIKLKNSDCKCSKNWKRKIFLYPILLFSTLMILGLFLVMKISINYLIS